MSVTTSRTLSPQHLDQLHASGITDAVISQRGYATVTVKSELARVGFSRIQQNVPALLIPLYGHDGRIVLHQLRPDQPRISRGKPVKYEVPTRSKLVIDVPPGVRGKVLSPDSPLFITEGIKKADAAASHEAACVGLLGVWGWKNQDDFWRNVPIRGRVVYIVFDSDIERNPDVKRASAALFAFLESMGALPKLILLPAKDGAKVGLDDFFAAGNSVEALLSHVTHQAPSFVEEIRDRDVADYEEHDGGIVRIVPTRDGLVRKPLTNFTARIVGQTVFIRGSKIERELEIEATVGGNSEIGTLTAVEYDRLDWVISLLGAEAVIYAGHGFKDEVRAAIQMLSGNIPKFVGVDRLGWHDINGTPVYVHAEGVILAETQVWTDLIEDNRADANALSEKALTTMKTDGPISPALVSQLGIHMRIPKPLARYALPVPSPDQQQLRADIRAGRSHVKSGSQEDFGEVVVVPAGGEAFVFEAALGGALLFQQA